ncbi:MAG: DUF3108 domain-containing protein [Bacteroidales bacterium]|nr:DUF3108 domain-containing protein [Bacteroidales bacterium]
MKRFFSLILLLALGCPVRAQSLPPGDETLSYTVRHNLFPGDIGTMTFRAKDDGGNYNVDATLKAAVGSIYTLDCRYTSVFRNDARLTPVAATRSQTEKKYWAKGRYEWSSPGHVHLVVNKSTRAPRDESIDWSGNVRDLLGTIWWLRSLDYGKAASGNLDGGSNALLLDHDALPVSITSCKRKSIKSGGKQVPVIEVAIAQDGKEVLRLTLSDDTRRIPLRFSLSLPFGNIKGTLKP